MHHASTTFICARSRNENNIKQTFAKKTIAVIEQGYTRSLTWELIVFCNVINQKKKYLVNI